MTATAAAADSANGPATGFGSKGYRSYVLIALTLVYTLNFIDRAVITVIAQPIMNEFSLTDEQWGVLTGWPFALFYAVMGIPIAMWADRGNRVFIISLCIVLWSLMTVFCGLAAGFMTLLLCRVGVAIGEAGCTPPANAIITDYYTPASRASALGVYGMGVTIGGLLAQLFGGKLASLKGLDVGSWIEGIGLGWMFTGVDWANVDGWRMTFILVGLPGVLVAALLFFTVREPPRGYSEPKGYTAPARTGFADAFKEFGRKPTFWMLALGAAFVAFTGYGLNSFQAPFLQRVHGVSVSDAALYYGAPLAAVAAVGTFLGGWTTEKLTPRFPAVAAWLPTVVLLIAAPAYIMAFLSENLSVAFVFWLVAAIAHYAYISAQYVVTMSIVSPRVRATTLAVVLLIISLIGNGFGPYFTGAMSSGLMKSILAKSGLQGELPGFDPKTCAMPKVDISETAATVCEAYGNGLQMAMAWTAAVLILAALFYFLASRTYLRDQYRAA